MLKLLEICSLGFLLKMTLCQLQVGPNIVLPKSVCVGSDIYDEELDACLSKVNALESICPKNCRRDGLVCNCIEEVPLQSLCPSDYEPTGPKLCTKKIEIEALLECERGLKWVEKKQKCVGVKLSTPELVCLKNDSTLINGICLTYAKKALQNICSDGYTLQEEKLEVTAQNNKYNSRNVRNFSVLPQLGEDNKPITYSCVKLTITPYNYSCSENYRLNEDQQMCTIHKYIDPIPRCLEGYQYNKTLDNCVNILGEPANRICPKDYVLEGFKCVQSSFVLPEPRCRDGFIYSIDESTCIKVLREPPSMRCPSDDYVFDGKSCELRDVVKSNIVCSSGSSFDEKLQKCINQVVLPAQMRCNEGYNFDEEKRKCYKIEVKKSDKICPIGMQYSKEKDTCIKLDKRKSEKGCPYGFVISDTEQICIQENIDIPKLVCKEPYILMGGDCLLDVETDPNRVCPDGFKLDEKTGICILLDSVNANLGCPSEYSEYAEKCIRQVKKDPTSVCPVNSRLNPVTNECYSIKKSYKECPVGYKPANPTITQCIQVMSPSSNYHHHHNHYHNHQQFGNMNSVNIKTAPKPRNIFEVVY